MIRILLVDDHPVVRQGIRQILIDGLKAVSIGEANDVPTATARIQADAWDIVVLDLTLPGRLNSQTVAGPAIAVFQRVCHAVCAPCAARPRVGYLTKDRAPGWFRRRRHRAAASIGSRLPGGRARDPRLKAPHGELSDRGHQVLRMIGSGKTVSKSRRRPAQRQDVSTCRVRLLELRCEATRK